MLLAIDPFRERGWGLILDGLRPDSLAAVGYFVNKVLDTQANDARSELRRQGQHEVGVPAIQIWRDSKSTAEIAALESRGVEIERYEHIADVETLKDLSLLRLCVEQNDKFDQLGNDDQPTA